MICPSPLLKYWFQRSKYVPLWNSGLAISTNFELTSNEWKALYEAKFVTEDRFIMQTDHETCLDTLAITRNAWGTSNFEDKSAVAKCFRHSIFESNLTIVYMVLAHYKYYPFTIIKFTYSYWVVTHPWYEWVFKVFSKNSSARSIIKKRFTTKKTNIFFAIFFQSFYVTNLTYSFRIFSSFVLYYFSQVL